MAIEIVDFPIKNGDFPLLFVCLPEGTSECHRFELFDWFATRQWHPESDHTQIHDFTAACEVLGIRPFIFFL